MPMQISDRQAEALGPASPCQPATAPEPGTTKPAEDRPVTRSVIVLALDKPDWIGVELRDTKGRPVPLADFVVHLPNHDPVRGTLDAMGRARIEGVDPGTATIEFPKLDKRQFV